MAWSPSRTVIRTTRPTDGVTSLAPPAPPGWSLPIPRVPGHQGQRGPTLPGLPPEPVGAGRLPAPTHELQPLDPAGAVAPPSSPRFNSRSRSSSAARSLEPLRLVPEAGPCIRQDLIRLRQLPGVHEGGQAGQPDPARVGLDPGVTLSRYESAAVGRPRSATRPPPDPQGSSPAGTPYGIAPLPSRSPTPARHGGGKSRKGGSSQRAIQGREGVGRGLQRRPEELQVRDHPPRRQLHRIVPLRGTSSPQRLAQEPEGLPEEALATIRGDSGPEKRGAGVATIISLRDATPLHVEEGEHSQGSPPGCPPPSPPPSSKGGPAYRGCGSEAGSKAWSEVDSWRWAGGARAGVTGPINRS